MVWGKEIKPRAAHGTRPNLERGMDNTAGVAPRGLAERSARFSPKLSERLPHRGSSSGAVGRTLDAPCSLYARSSTFTRYDEI